MRDGHEMTDAERHALQAQQYMTAAPTSAVTEPVWVEVPRTDGAESTPGNEQWQQVSYDPKTGRSVPVPRKQPDEVFVPVNRAARRMQAKRKRR